MFVMDIAFITTTEILFCCCCSYALKPVRPAMAKTGNN